MTQHNWPKNGEHLWGKWMAYSNRSGTKPPKDWRRCVHPDCKEIEYRDV